MSAQHTPLADEDILAAARQLTVAGRKGFAAPRILAALCAAEATAQDVFELIQHEPGLAARVLRVANSALYGVRGGVGTIKRAVQLLGLDAVRGIAAAACFNRSTTRSKLEGPVDLDELQRHCIATAVAAESLARIRHDQLVGVAFIAGLLHDFGTRLVLGIGTGALRRFSDPHWLGADPEPSAAQLLDNIKASHEHCGAVALESWGLPRSLVAAARYHHDPGNAPQPDAELTALVHVADCLSRTLGLGFATETDPREPQADATALLRLSATDIEDVANGLLERVAVLNAALEG
jgi:HD-like signal output (HDOD) protein